MNLHYLPLFLFGASVANAELDLYVREKFVTADGETKCGSCQEGNGCFLGSRAFFLQKSCFNRGYTKASVYDEVDDGVVCRQDFRESCDDEDHEFDAEDVDGCKDVWNIGECTDAEQMTKLKSWCKETSEAEGEYTIPLLTFKEYGEVRDCGVSPEYTSLLLPDEGGSCVPLSFPSNGEFVSGSRKVSCDGSVYNAILYTSTDCTGDAVKSRFGGTTDQCPASSEESRIYTNDCGAPTIYCKASASISGSSGNASENTEESGSRGGAIITEGESTGASTTPGGLLLVAMALLSWIA